MALYELDGVAPVVPDSAWVAESAEVIGRVELGEDVSVWPGCLIRGDQPEPVRIGRGSNVQEATVMHSDAGVPLTIGEDVTIGHRATLHGCTIGDGSLIGIGAVVLNGARIGRHCLVGAGALVTEGKVFPDGVLIVGSPAVVKRELSPEQIERLKLSAQHYVANGQRFKTRLHRVG
ncbi:gamma carbonic anhydrase family protein [Ideonella livida]|uniref:Gamma carbonic anhydrase family protein n=1 Tax=Ideonella livida TaxID=2707176 RepID=A0A7C9PIS5_9BURK|nr:gamma carbonic anhydrase family protein [Ideonella livida]NDY92956.1 gamma carbonic anhydrase family protein [Ideonella livida]